MRLIPQAEVGDVDPVSAVVALASLTVALVSARQAVLALRSAHPVTVEVAARLAIEMRHRESQAHARLLGGRSRTIDVDFDFRPAPAHDAGSAAGGGASTPDAKPCWSWPTCAAATPTPASPPGSASPLATVCRHIHEAVRVFADLAPDLAVAARVAARIRALGERAVSTLKTWRLLRRLRCSTTRITDLTRAVLTLHLNAE